MKILQLLLQVIITSDYNLNPQLNNLGAKIGLEFKGSCLKQDKITYDHENLYCL